MSALESLLLFEQDELLVRSLRRAFRMQTVVVATADEARELLSRNNWTAVALNVMPNGEGLVLLDGARQGGCTCPAMVLAPHFEESWLHRALFLNAFFALTSVEESTVAQFARRAKSRPLPSPHEVVRSWARKYSLTPTETEILLAATEGETHIQISSSRGISPRTLQKHIENLLRKTHDDTLAAAAVRVLREALREPRVRSGTYCSVRTGW